MSNPPIWARKVDSNHRTIAKTFKQLHWNVRDVHTAPNFFDLIVWRAGHLFFIEVKQPGEKLRSNQDKLHQEFLDCNLNVRVIRSKSDVFDLTWEVFGSR